ncbi:tetratricopeptide repeat protein [Thalassotalea piscium]|uniref:tetratricopeptide repeat protein n=1 Tax=Thalassotalea piscium TaxID=1230533 RepID=UPI002572DF1C|nr:hypothetical protein [Thalassotalea piscium]
MLKKSLYYLDRDLDKAEDIIVKALEEAPEDAEVNFVCGRIMGKQAENTIIYALSYAKKSLSCLRKAVKLEPSEIRYKLGLLNFYLGAPSIAGGDVNLAHEQVAAISTVDEMQGAKAKVKFLMATEQNKKLKAYLMSARKKYPDDAEFHFRSGLLSQQNKMYEQAYEAFKAAIQTHEASSHYLNAMYQLGRNAVLSNLYIEEGAEMLQIYIKIHNIKMISLLFHGLI